MIQLRNISPTWPFFPLYSNPLGGLKDKELPTLSPLWIDAAALMDRNQKAIVSIPRIYLPDITYSSKKAVR